MTLISLYICVSADGFIADKSGGVGWLPPMGPEAQGNYETFFSSVEALVMGSHSYQKVLSFGMGWPYEGKIVYVFSKRELDTQGREDIKVTNEEPVEFVQRIRSECPEIRKVWLMGGAQLTKSFADAGLIDEVSLFTVPKSIEEGLPLGIDLETGFDQSEEGVLGDVVFKAYKKKV